MEQHQCFLEEFDGAPPYICLISLRSPGVVSVMDSSEDPQNACVSDPLFRSVTYLVPGHFLLMWVQQNVMVQ